MKNIKLLLCIAMVGLSGCATVADPNVPEFKYKVNYTDKNDDGYIDAAFFALVGGADGDFTLQDTDFDGRYDKATVYGIGVFHREVDYPVYLDSERRKLNRSYLAPR